jgi:hypothetical protein
LIPQTSKVRSDSLISKFDDQTYLVLRAIALLS